jgi:hypothetical protein
VSDLAHPEENIRPREHRTDCAHDADPTWDVNLARCARRDADKNDFIGTDSGGQAGKAAE